MIVLIVIINHGKKSSKLRNPSTLQQTKYQQTPQIEQTLHKEEITKETKEKELSNKEMLSLLEIRLVRGDISEETYNKLEKKYEK